MSSMSRNKLLCTLVLAGSLLLSACQSGSTAQTDGVLLTDALILPDQANYTTIPVESTTYQRSGQGAAAVAYPVYANLSWENGDARFLECLVSPGTEVKKGDVLVRVDIEASTVRLQSLQLQLKRAQEDFEAGKAERLDEIHDMAYRVQYSRQMLPLQQELLQIDYEKYVYETEREISEIREEISDLQKTLQENTIVAPFDGVIDNIRPHNPGDRIATGEAMLTMHSTDRFLLSVSGTVHNLRYNMPVSIMTGNRDNPQTYTGRVVCAPNIAPSAEEIDYALVKMDDGITDDMFQFSTTYQCTVEELGNVLVVNREAVETDSAGSFVYILEDGIVKKRYVEAQLNNMEAVWILDGLSEGQSLVLD